ncbi:unnamed protein product, partial [Coregonus sp. 'balchen']
VSGNVLPLYSIVGGDVSLPCTNVIYPNCSSTIWNYGSIEEVGHGRVKKEEQNNRADRLSLGSDCSLHVSDVRAEDAGVYICQQFLTWGGPQHGGDAPVHLSVLTVSSSSPVTDIKPDRPVTLRCSLHTLNRPGRCAPGINQDVSTSNAVKLPISRIMLFVTLTVMAAIVTIHTTRRNLPPKALHPQAEEASGIELQVLEE